ncbi:hypothetical protein RCL1_006894 [Eukaryota sp. TZLM3-RCL]
MLTTARYLYYKATLIPEKSVVLLGFDDTCKTTILASLTSHLGQPPLSTPSIPTHGVNLSEIKHSGLSLSVRDVGGSTETLRRNWKYHYDADIFIFVLNISDNLQQECIENELKSLVCHCTSNNKTLIICNHTSSLDSSSLLTTELINPFQWVEGEVTSSQILVFDTDHDGKGIGDLWTALVLSLKK